MPGVKKAVHGAEAVSGKSDHAARPMPKKVNPGDILTRREGKDHTNFVFPTYSMKGVGVYVVGLTVSSPRGCDSTPTAMLTRVGLATQD